MHETAEGAELFFHMWQFESRIVATLELEEQGVGQILVGPVTVEDGATGGGVMAATTTPGTKAALFSVYPPHALALQRLGVDGTGGPVVPLSVDVGPAVFGGHVAPAEGPGGGEHLVTYAHFTPAGNGPHLEPRVALFDEDAQLTHGPAMLETPPEHLGAFGSLSSIWVDDHALTAVARSACWSPEACGPAVAVHRSIPATGGQLEASTVWTHEAPDESQAALAERDGRVWIALYDGNNDVAKLKLWELAADGSIMAGPVTVDTGQTPGSPASPPLGWGGPGLTLVATPWGLVASAMKLTEQSPPSGALVMAEIGVVHLGFDLQTLSPPVTIPVVDPSQHSPPRLVATADGAVVVWEARGLPQDAPFSGPNNAGRVHLARLVCEP